MGNSVDLSPNGPQGSNAQNTLLYQGAKAALSVSAINSYAALANNQTIQVVENTVVGAVSNIGKFSFSDGTAAAPIISWLTDSGCGIYHSGSTTTGKVGVAINGTSVAVVESGGLRVTAPGTGLQYGSSLALHSTAVANCIYYSNNNGDAIAYVGVVNGGGILIASSQAYDYVVRSLYGITLSANNGASIGLRLDSSNDITIPRLAGTGTRHVVVDANGKLSAP